MSGHVETTQARPTVLTSGSQSTATECVVLNVSHWIQVDSITGYLLTVDQNYKIQERSQSYRVQGEEASQSRGGLDQVH